MSFADAQPLQARGHERKPPSGEMADDIRRFEAIVRRVAVR
jgi:hypothetical protein